MSPGRSQTFPQPPWEEQATQTTQTNQRNRLTSRCPQRSTVSPRGPRIPGTGEEPDILVQVSIWLTGVSPASFVFPQVWMCCAHECLLRFLHFPSHQALGPLLRVCSLATWLLITSMSRLWPGCIDSLMSYGWGAGCLTHVFLAFSLTHACLTFSGHEAIGLTHLAYLALFPVVQAILRTLINQGGKISRIALDEGFPSLKFLIPDEKFPILFLRRTTGTFNIGWFFLSLVLFSGLHCRRSCMGRT